MANLPADDRSLEAVNDELYASGATDGLPVVPPTEDRVEEMLRGTDRDRDDELGRLGNREGRLTVEKLATNAVMAGCLPTHLPVVIAGARALADPESNSIQISVSTGSWAYLWLVNGPVRGQLDIRSDTGAFGPSFRANRCIARALGLAYDNTALIYPGEKDMGVLGSPFKHSLLAGENEERSPFEPFHVSAGYDADQSTITFGGPHGFVQYTNRYAMDAEGVFKSMIYNTPPDMVGIEGRSLSKHVFHALAPYNAQELADAGLAKADVKQYLYENSAMPHYEYQSGVVLEGTGDQGPVPALQVPQYADPDQIVVVVIGGSGRVNAVMGGSLGGPVTKEIEFPDGWDELVEEYAPQRAWGGRPS